MLRIHAVLGGSAASLAAIAAVFLSAGQAGAQPIFTPQPGGVIKVEAAPGEWWKCALYTRNPAEARGIPPIVNYPSGVWSHDEFATPAAYVRFPPNTEVLADCMSQYAPNFWLQVLNTIE